MNLKGLLDKAVSFLTFSILGGVVILSGVLLMTIVLEINNSEHNNTITKNGSFFSGNVKSSLLGAGSLSLHKFENNKLNNKVTVKSNGVPNVVETPVKPLSNKVIKKLELERDRVIPIFGIVSSNALSAAEDVVRMNQESQERPIYIVINSPGGSVITGALLISAMQASTAPVHTICYGICASMGAMIHQYGKTRYAVDRALIMFHPATTGSMGDVDRIYSYIKTIKRYTNKLEVDIAVRMGLTFEQYKNLIVNELWVDSEDSKKQNIVDDIVYVVMKSETPSYMSFNNEVPIKIPFKVTSGMWINKTAINMYNQFVGAK